MHIRTPLIKGRRLRVGVDGRGSKQQKKPTGGQGMSGGGEWEIGGGDGQVGGEVRMERR